MIAPALIAPGLPTAWAAIGVVVLFVGLWAVSVRISDAGIVDPFWGPAFFLVALITALTATSHPLRVHVTDGSIISSSRPVHAPGGLAWVLVVMTGMWALRLGAFLLARFLRHGEEDPRYQAIRKRHPDDFTVYSLVAIYGTQALLVLIISLPLQTVARTGHAVTAAAIPGIVIWAAGLIIEALSDQQRRNFSKAKPPREAVLDTGFWRYSRHPNKFGDFLVWWGLWLTALTAGGTWWTVIGPLVMSGILLVGTRRGDDAKGDSPQAAYVRRTSGFVLLPPRGD